MQLGVCTGVDNAALLKNMGWDFIEGNVQGLLKGTEVEWTCPVNLATSALPMVAANCLVPGNLKITGPEVNPLALQFYMTNVLARAAKAGLDTLVFGSGGARNVPEGFDRTQARAQIIAFLQMAAPLAQSQKVTIVIEHLNRKECNIINSVGEGLEYARAVNHPNIKVLADTYHFWLEDESLENLRAAAPLLAHIHMADKEGRVAPGISGKSDYRPFFTVLKAGGYNGRLSVEAGKFDLAATGQQVCDYLKKEWAAA